MESWTTYQLELLFHRWTNESYVLSVKLFSSVPEQCCQVSIRRLHVQIASDSIESIVFAWNLLDQI